MITVAPPKFPDFSQIPAGNQWSEFYKLAEAKFEFGHLASELKEFIHAQARELGKIQNTPGTLHSIWSRYPALVAIALYQAKSFTAAPTGDGTSKALNHEVVASAHGVEVYLGVWPDAFDKPMIATDLFHDQLQVLIYEAKNNDVRVAIRFDDQYQVQEVAFDEMVEFPGGAPHRLKLLKLSEDSPWLTRRNEKEGAPPAHV